MKGLKKKDKVCMHTLYILKYQANEGQKFICKKFNQ
jgi:hypothetical protein